MSTLDHLRSVPLFAGLTARQLAQAAQLFESRTVPAGHVLAVEGRPGGEVAIVVEGQARIDRRGCLIGVAAAGDVVGASTPLPGAAPAGTVTALAPMQLLVAGAAPFRTFVEHPAVRAYLAVGEARS